MPDSKTILILGAFDTKGPDHDFVRRRILERGHRVRTANVGTLGSTELFDVDIEADEFARAGGSDIEQLRAAGDRGEAMKVMAAGARRLIREKYDAGAFDAVIGMAGSGGASIITAGMQALPIGVPKVCVSTVAGADTSPYVGLSDVVLIPAVVDVAGLNRLSRIVYTRAAGAVCGMAESEPAPSADDRPVIAATMLVGTSDSSISDHGTGSTATCSPTSARSGPTTASVIGNSGRITVIVNRPTSIETR